jgi:hyperosmotically inducible periplasmic protein
MLIRPPDHLSAQQRHDSEREHGIHQQPIGEAISDGVITARVKGELMAYELTAGRDIRVNTTAGIVELSGFAETATACAAAVLIAQNVAGVRDVHDEMDCRTAR